MFFSLWLSALCRRPDRHVFFYYIHANEAWTETEDDESPWPTDGCRDSVHIYESRHATVIQNQYQNAGTWVGPDAILCLYERYNELSLEKSEAGLLETRYQNGKYGNECQRIRMLAEPLLPRLWWTDVPKEQKQVWVISKAVTVYIYVFHLNIYSNFRHIYVKVTSLPPQREHI